MMFRRFHAGHGLGLGVLIGYGMAGYRPWLILALGILIGLSVSSGIRLARQLLSAFEAWKANSRPKHRKSDFVQKYDPSKIDIPY